MGTAVLEDCGLKGFCVDTRRLCEGELFFALPGSKTDGHSFLAEAAVRGAVACVVSEGYKGESFGLPLLRVLDVQSALQALAKAVIAQSKALVVAVTGSVGKTTTKEFVAALLRKKFRVAQTPGNGNSQIGLPLAILNQTSGEEDVLVLEMSLSAQGHIKKLVEIAPPDIALITTTALVHAENFDSLESIGRAKAEIFSHPKTRLGILHYDILNREEICLSSPCFKVTFSTKKKEADYCLEESFEGMKIAGTRFAPVVLGSLGVPAKHNRHNFLAAAVTARHLGMDWREIEEAMTDLRLPEKRMEIVEKGGVLFINDSYNASEMSVKAALDSLPQPEGKGKRVAVLGEMLELGKFSDECHRAVGEYALNCVDVLVCYGAACHPIEEVWSAAGKPVVLALERETLVRSVKAVVKVGDVVLLKGSRSKGMWTVLDEF